MDQLASKTQTKLALSLCRRRAGFALLRRPAITPSEKRLASYGATAHASIRLAASSRRGADVDRHTRRVFRLYAWNGGTLNDRYREAIQ